VTEIYVVGDLPVWHVSPGFEPRYDGSLLVAHVREVVDDGSWVRGSIEEFPTTVSLVIRQTQANHERIARALDRLRAQRKAAAIKAAASN